MENKSAQAELLGVMQIELFPSAIQHPRRAPPIPSLSFAIFSFKMAHTLQFKTLFSLIWGN